MNAGQRKDGGASGIGIARRRRHHAGNAATRGQMVPLDADALVPSQAGGRVGSDASPPIHGTVSRSLQRVGDDPRLRGKLRRGIDVESEGKGIKKN